MTQHHGHIEQEWNRIIMAMRRKEKEKNQKATEEKAERKKEEKKNKRTERKKNPNVIRFELVEEKSDEERREEKN